MCHNKEVQIEGDTTHFPARSILFNFLLFVNFYAVICVKRISLDVDAPTTSFSVPDNLVNIRILVLESIASQKIQNPFHALAWMLVNKRNCFFIACKKRTLLKSDFSFIGDGYYHNKILKKNICRLIFISSMIQGK